MLIIVLLICMILLKAQDFVTKFCVIKSVSLVFGTGLIINKSASYFHDENAKISHHCILKPKLMSSFCSTNSPLL